MPPPTLTDSWLASRKFGIVIDAGSSGSRLQIYSWKDARTVRLEWEDSDPSRLHALPMVEKGTKSSDDWQVKANPGISTFGSEPEGVAAYLEPLIAHAKEQIPPSLHSTTPIFLLATAGMRLLPPSEQSAVLSAACDYISDHSHFQLDSTRYDASSSSSATTTVTLLPGTEGTRRCGRSIRIISGEEEGLFGWIAVNYLMNGFALRHSDHDKPTTFGFLDMGGASTQIAFEPSETAVMTDEQEENLAEVRLRLLNGEEIRHSVFVTTWLGFGTNQARERYISQNIADLEAEYYRDAQRRIRPRASPPPTTPLQLEDPCLPKHLVLHNKYKIPVLPGETTPATYTPVTLIGTGSFPQCIARTAPLLNKGTPCLRPPCLFNGVHVPPIDFAHHRGFIGVSEYWYSSQHVFHLGGAFDFAKYEEAAERFCGRDWEDIVREHEENVVLGEGGTWHKDVDVSRLKMQCFKAAWIINVLGEGVGIPRTSKDWGKKLGADGTSTVGGELKADEEKVEKLGLDEGEIPNPIFQSVDTIKGTAVSWTLGKMVLEASKGIPAANPKTADPISDPMAPAIPFGEGANAPGRLPFGLDFASIERHFPEPLRREALGFSPVLLLMYLLIVVFIGFAGLRVRRRFRSSWRKWQRGSMKRDYSNEEGGIGLTSASSGSESSPPMSPTFGSAQLSSSAAGAYQSMLASAPMSFLSQFISSLRRAVTPLPNPRRGTTTPPSSQYPSSYQPSITTRGVRATPPPLNMSAASTPSQQYHHHQSLSQSSIYLTPIKIDDSIASAGPGSPPNGLNPNGLSALSLSRNSSQVNLTRTVPTPRTVSGFSTPIVTMGGGTTPGVRTPRTPSGYHSYDYD